MFPVFKLSQENTQPENMCHIIFENIEAVVQRCSVKKVFLEISQNSQENACLLFNKVAGLGLQLY